MMTTRISSAALEPNIFEFLFANHEACFVIRASPTGATVNAIVKSGYRVADDLYDWLEAVSEQLSDEFSLSSSKVYDSLCEQMASIASQADSEN